MRDRGRTSYLNPSVLVLKLHMRIYKQITRKATGKKREKTKLSVYIILPVPTRKGPASLVDCRQRLPPVLAPTRQRNLWTPDHAFSSTSSHTWVVLSSSPYATWKSRVGGPHSPCRHFFRLVEQDGNLMQTDANDPEAAVLASTRRSAKPSTSRNTSSKGVEIAQSRLGPRGKKLSQSRVNRNSFRDRRGATILDATAFCLWRNQLAPSLLSDIATYQNT